MVVGNRGNSAPGPLPRHIVQDHRLGSPRKCRCVFRDRPDLIPQEPKEILRLVEGREIQVDDDVAGIVDGLSNTLGSHTGLTPGIRDPIEGRKPCLKVADVVLDVQGEHPFPFR